MNKQTFLFIALLAQSTTQDCLTNTVLTSLGFPSAAAKTTAEKITTPSVCKNLFDSAGTCVTESEVKSLIQKQQNTLFDRTAIKAKVSGVLDDIKDSLTDQAQKDKITKIKDALKDSHTPCFKALDVMQMGAACLTASGNGTNQSTTGNGNLTILVTDEIKTSLESCLPWFDALCLVGTGISISQEVVLTNDLFRKNANEYETACKNLKAAYTCTAPCTERTRIMAEDLKPLVLNFWPDITLWNTILDSFKNIASKTSDWFKNTFSRRLLGSSTYQVLLKIDNTNGVKLVTYGQQSGVELKDAHNGIFFFNLTAILVYLFQ